MKRIQEVLLSRKYNFINLSIGPELPVEDDDVHAWTAVLDEYLSDGEILASIAIGNGGKNNRESGNARIQVPSDCVNALAVGAASSIDGKWKRADYSSIGPGRRPGVIKPDILAFGGTYENPFWVSDLFANGNAIPQSGTSFSAPLALRMAMGIRAHFGEALSPLAIKALMIHCSEDNGSFRIETGWGRIPNNLDEFVICPDGVARIVYQGEIRSRQYIRAKIPIPAAKLEGKVKIKATFCFSTEIDPQDPSNYTRSGLDICFRPNIDNFEKGKIHPKTDSFFLQKDYCTEEELRRDALKWETVLHREKSMLGSSLKDPVFDIHYNARECGQQTNRTSVIKYALIVTVESPRTKDLYNRIINRYPTQLRPLTPAIQIPIRT